MKTRSKTEAVHRHSGTRLPFSALFILAVAASPMPAEPAAPPKDHALFIGTSLQVEDNGSYRELVGVSAHTVTVLADGTARELPRKAVGAVRIEPGLKISNLVAQIDGLKTTAVKADVKGDRFAADRMKLLLDSVVGQNEEQMDMSANEMASMKSWMGAATTAESAAGFAQSLATATAGFQGAASTNTSLGTSVSSILPGGELATAVEVSCELSAPRATRNAYALLVTEYRVSSHEKPTYLVHVEPLEALGPKPRRVTMTQLGLPPGFTVGRVDVHVYADGQELATNLSPQRVDLTADEALRYLVLSYVATHAKDTLAAAPLQVTLPADFKQRVPSEQQERTLYVKVGIDGTVRDLSAEAGRTVAVDPYIDSAVRKFRYNPALQAGKPVESVVELKLASLLR